jgi:segregation and condensation protein B
MNQPLHFILEAAIMASHQPLSIEQLSELFDESARPSHTDIAQTLEALSAQCAERGVELVEVASGFRYQIKTSVYPHVARLWTERQSKYSRALLETLSLIAYRQPITRPEIEAVRGVAVSSHIIRTLEEREWIRVVGHREVPGRPALFGTTRGFLDYFKLKSLEDLPTLSEIKDLDDAAPEFDFGAPLIAPLDLPVQDDPIVAEQPANTEMPQNELEAAQIPFAEPGAEQREDNQSSHSEHDRNQSSHSEHDRNQSSHSEHDISVDPIAEPSAPSQPSSSSEDVSHESTP